MSALVASSGGIWRILAALSLVLAGMSACSQPPAASTPTSGDGNTAQGGATMKLTVRSTAFDGGARIPKQQTGEGPDTSPALSWSEAPAGTAELALIMDDPDAPQKEPWVHWVLYKVPKGTTALPEALAKTETLKDPAGALQGKNSFGRIGYNGPMPPPGHGTHHYHFKVYALDQALVLAPGATKAQLLDAMRGHILAEGELIGTYSR